MSSLPLKEVRPYLEFSSHVLEELCAPLALIRRHTRLRTSREREGGVRQGLFGQKGGLHVSIVGESMRTGGLGGSGGRALLDLIADCLETPCGGLL